MPETRPNTGAQDEQTCGRAASPSQGRTSRATVPGLCPRPRLVGLHQAAEYLGCSYWSIRTLVDRGSLPTVRLPGIRRYLIDVADLDRLIDRSKEAV